MRRIVARAFCFMAAGCLTPIFLQAGVNQWTSLGPEGGVVRAIAVDPSTPSTIYVGTDRGGVFKSTNAGASWNSASFGLGAELVGSLAVDPALPSTIYAGASAEGTIAGGGVFKSTDGGASWHAVNDGLGAQAQFGTSVTIDPSRTSTLYAVGPFRAYRSTNAGGSWVEIAANLQMARLSALVVDPSNSSVLYLGTGSGLFKSIDGGANWFGVNLGLQQNSITALAIDAANPKTLFAGTLVGVFRTSDGGSSWSPLNEDLTFAITALAPDRRASSTIYAGTSNGLFRSVDSGITWTSLRAFGNRPLAAVTLDPTTPSTIYAAGADSEGVFKSIDGGTNWLAANSGLHALSITALAIDPNRPSTILVSTSGFAAVFASRDSGTTWQQATAGLRTAAGYVPQVNALVIDPTNSATIYAGTSNGVFRSSDGGTSWYAINSGLPTSPYFSTPDVDSLVIDPASPQTVYAGIFLGVPFGGGVVKSLDGGANWKSTSLYGDAVAALAIDPQNTSKLFAAFAGITNLHAAKSTDAAASWTDLPGLFDKAVRTFLVDPRTSVVYAGSPYGVFKSVDGGDTWLSASTGLVPEDPRFPIPDIRSLAIDPSGPPTLYAGSYGGGVFNSPDGGSTWTTFNRGLSGLLVTVVAQDPLDPTKIYAATDGNGLFRVTVGGLHSPRESRVIKFR